MATEKQIAANRRNAQLSTGPRTAAGKARASRNGFLKGQAERQLAFRLGQAEEFAVLHRGLVDDWQPVGTAEAELVDRIAADFWRLRRAASLESGLLDRRDPDNRSRPPPAELGPDRPYRQDLVHSYLYAHNSGADFAKMARWQGAIERSLHRNLETLARLQEHRSRRPAGDEGEAAADRGEEETGAGALLAEMV